jgi:hypothetical protein
MKKLALALSLAIATSTSAFAHEGFRGGYHGGYYHNGYNWVAPLIVGGAVGYALSQPRTVYVTPPPVVYTNPPPVVYNPPVGYHYESILDANCNCYRNVLVQN